MAIIHDGNSVPISSTNPLPSSLFGSEIQVPVDIQSRYATTTQTQAGVLIAPSGVSATARFDCIGFDRIAVTVTNDAATTSAVTLYWSNDGATDHGRETVLTSVDQRKAVEVTTKARYVKVEIFNGDAAPHTMSSWIYLKA